MTNFPKWSDIRGDIVATSILRDAWSVLRLVAAQRSGG